MEEFNDLREIIAAIVDIASAALDENDKLSRKLADAHDENAMLSQELKDVCRKLSEAQKAQKEAEYYRKKLERSTSDIEEKENQILSKLKVLDKLDGLDDLDTISLSEQADEIRRGLEKRIDDINASGIHKTLDTVMGYVAAIYNKDTSDELKEIKELFDKLSDEMGDMRKYLSDIQEQKYLTNIQKLSDEISSLRTFIAEHMPMDNGSRAFSNSQNASCYNMSGGYEGSSSQTNDDRNYQKMGE